MARCLHLNLLLLEGCRELSGWAVAGASPSLRSLALGGCTLVTDAGVGALTRSCRHLESLCLRQCRAVSDGSLAVIAAHCAALTRLDVSRCGAVTDAGLEHLSRGCPQLRALEMEGYAEVRLPSYHP